MLNLFSGFSSKRLPQASSVAPVVITSSTKSQCLGLVFFVFIWKAFFKITLRSFEDVFANSNSGIQLSFASTTE